MLRRVSWDEGMESRVREGGLGACVPEMPDCMADVVVLYCVGRSRGWMLGRIYAGPAATALSDQKSN